MLHHDRILMIHFGVRRIKHQQYQIGRRDFLKGGPEGRGKRFRQIPYEPYCIRHDHFALLRKSYPPGNRVQRREQLIARRDRAIGQVVEQGRLARIRVSDDGNDRDIAIGPSLSTQTSAPAQFFDFALELRNARTRATLVNLQFRLTWPPASDAPGQPRHRSMLSTQSRQQVAQLGQFNLQLGLTFLGPLRENIQNHLGAIQDFDIAKLRNVLDLRRSQVTIEEEYLGPGLHRLDDYALKFTPPHDVARIGRAALSYLLHHIDSRAPGQLFQLGQGLIHLGWGVGGHMDDNGPIPSRVRFSGCTLPGELLFQ